MKQTQRIWLWHEETQIFKGNGDAFHMETWQLQAPLLSFLLPTLCVSLFFPGEGEIKISQQKWSPIPPHTQQGAPLTQPHQIEKGLEWERKNYLLKVKIMHRR